MQAEKQAIEDILVEYHDIFARIRTNIGVTTDIKVELTPKVDKTVYNQNSLMPIRLRRHIIVGIALNYKNGNIAVLPFSRYASPIFAQRKPNAKYCLPMDLRKMNLLTADDYTDNNHSLSTLSDTTQHLAGISLSCILDCSQAYHCLQLADQQAVEMLAFNLT